MGKLEELSVRLCPQRSGVEAGRVSGMETLVRGICGDGGIGMLGKEEMVEQSADRFPLFLRPPLRGARADGEGGGWDSPGFGWG